MDVDAGAPQDLVIVLPGIMGSALVDAENHAVWSLGPRSLVRAIGTLGRSLKSLELPAGIGDEHPGDGIRPTGLLGGLHVVPGLWSPIDGYGALLRFLGSKRFRLAASADSPARLIPFPYDWRLSNRYNATLLARTAGDALTEWRRRPGMADAKLVLICHSMGGLVARWFLEQEGGREIVRTLITIGTPHRGSARAVTTLVNGMDKGLGPFRLRLTDFARSLPSLHQLLPTYDCLTDAGKPRAALSVGGLPEPIKPEMIRDAATFHATLDDAPSPTYQFIKITGIRQPTATTIRIDGGHAVEFETIDGLSQGGDGTVPRLAAVPFAGRDVEVHEIAENHGSLQNARSALDLIDGLLTRDEIVWQGDDEAEPVGVWIPEVVAAGADIPIRVTDMDGRRILVAILDEDGGKAREPTPVSAQGRAVSDGLPPGAYTGMVYSPVPGGPSPVRRPFLVWDAESEAAE